MRDSYNESIQDRSSGLKNIDKTLDYVIIDIVQDGFKVMNAAFNNDSEKFPQCLISMQDLDHFIKIVTLEDRQHVKH